MSTEIKMPSVTTPPAVIKVGGKCYELKGAGKLGNPDNSLSNIQWSGTTCAACKAAGNVPAVCPCSTWGTFPCGAPDDQTAANYTITIADVVFTSEAYSHVALDLTEWDGALTYWTPSGADCSWHRAVTTERRIPGTDIGVGDLDNAGAGALQLIDGVAWQVIIRSSLIYGIWRKTTGNSPSGTYTVTDNGFWWNGFVNYAVSPSTIEVSAS